MGHWMRSFGLLLKWNLLRLRGDLVFFVGIQSLIAIGIVVGFSFMIPNLDTESALYLTTGAMTVSLITMGMSIAPQNVAQRKELGVLDYQRSMPVPRLALLAADAIVWMAVALPGLGVVLGTAMLRFDLDIAASPLLAGAIVLVSAASAAIGYGIAYLVKPVLVALISNAVLIIALMFAPVNYPANRLPDWAASMHAWLPFQYMAQAIRETTAVPTGGVPALPFVVLLLWTAAGLAVTSRVMMRRV